MPYWQYYNRNAAPQARAGSFRRKYGTSWWGKAFLEALNRLDYSGRLGRGKTYANKGLVEALDKGSDGRITAKVKGSRPTPYRISINWQPFSEAQQQQILELITNDYAILGRLLAGELPASLQEKLSDQGIQLFPTSWDALDVSCSCPDWATPCKHEAAVFYILAAEIDTDPFNIFILRGLPLRELLPAVFGDQQAQGVTEILALENLVRPVQPELPEANWSDTHLAEIDLAGIQPLGDRLFSLLPANPPFDPASDFRAYLEKNYQRTATYGKKLLKGKAAPPPEQSLLVATAQADLVIAADLTVSTLSLYDDEDEVLLELSTEDEIIQFLQRLESADSMLLCDDLLSLQLSFQFARQLIIRGAYVPQLLQRTSDAAYVLRYLPATNDPVVARQTGLVNALLSPGLPFYDGPQGLQEWLPTAAATAIISGVLQLMISQALGGVEEESPARRLFALAGAESFELLGTEAYPGAIQRWLNRLHIGQDRYQPIFLVEETDRYVSVDVQVRDRERPTTPALPLNEVLSEQPLGVDGFQLLRNLGQLSEHFPQLEDHLAGESFPMQFDLAEFTPILRRILPLMEAFGLSVVLPRAFKRLLRPSLGLSASSSGGALSSGIVSLDSIISFNWQAAIGDQPVDAEAFKELLANSTGLVKFREQYAFIDPDEVARLINTLESEPRLSPAERMQAIISEEYQGNPVFLDPELKAKIDQWRNGPPASPPAGLEATLRPYQERGYQWLYSNARFGFGSIIADDMGLGKTLQVIATLLKLKEEGDLEQSPALVVVPTSLLANWRNELDKFAPELSHHTYHGQERQLPDTGDFEVLLTTYGVVRNEVAKLNKIDWAVAVIDESQAIKNPAAAQTKAIKKIKAPLRIAMSGTPVENRLLDYWSVMDFTLPDYLGNKSAFGKQFGTPIQKERDKTVADRFKKVTAPFVLRRMKSDKSIISDLPDKIIQDEQCQLLPAQAALYESVVKENLRMVEESEGGIGRQGLILKLLTALKQVCNHPQHFLKKNQATFAESGKARLLRERLENILDNQDKVLIFTQYREMGDLLVDMIQEEFGLEVPFLHGGCSSKQREAMVEKFQTDRRTPIFILSIKAGGTGLNLTAANHVIHYDLWWNPAVENQATDRAYRIGQEKTVFVHRLITMNTFEEKIDQLIKSKTELANLTVGNGETWVGKLTNAELTELVKLE